MANYKEDLQYINTFIFDYDGVMSTGHVLITETGEHLREGYVRDGYALQLAVKSGYHVIVITGGKSGSIIHRCRALGIEEVYMGVDNKLEVLQRIMAEKDLKPENILYMGDDIPDMRAMQQIGMPVCPADAVEEIKAISRYISFAVGGRGCVRDVIRQVMKVQDKWLLDNAHHW